MADPFKRYRLVDDSKLDLAAIDSSRVPIDVPDVKRSLADLQDEIAAFQNALFAESRHGLLVVLQGMDTSGKDGATIATFRSTHPQGLRVVPFKAPSPEEAAHDFLWRVHAHVPAKGMIAVFNRSHYEAVIAERVLGLADRAECKRRYRQIVDFERMLVEHGTTIVKCFLHISKEEQKQRLQSRLDEPEKHWKFNPNDLVERARWDANMDAYVDALRETATRDAPWWIVPADRKGHRNLMVATVVRDALKAMAPQYPPLAADAVGIKVD